MANRIFTLMFQILGELIVCLAVLRASVQPCTISSKDLKQKVTLLLLLTRVYKRKGHINKILHFIFPHVLNSELSQISNLIFMVNKNLGLHYS